MTDLPDHLRRLERELRGVFGARLESLVAYGLNDRHSHAAAASHGAPHADSGTHTLAIVNSLSENDLKACADLMAAWHDAGLATPLLLTAGEFERSLDAFPLEFGAIVADHVVVGGRDPFEGLAVDAADLRRACEVQARSHLLHLRQGFLETIGRGDALAVLIVRSAAPFAALVASLARLEGVQAHDRAAAGRHVERTLNLPPGSVTGIVRLEQVAEISATEAVRIFPEYLNVVRQIVQYVDRWGGR